MNLGIGLGGLAAGQVARVAHPSSFTLLFVLDALTFVVYVAAEGTGGLPPRGTQCRA